MNSIKLITLLLALIISNSNLAASNSTITEPSSSPMSWSDYIDLLKPIAERVTTKMTDTDDPLLQQELYAKLFSTISVAYMGLFLGDVNHPDFWPIFNGAHNLGTPNPDAVYYLAPIDENGIYKVSGFRGTVKIADIQIGGGLFYPRGEGPPAPSFVNYDLDTLQMNSNGALEVIISAERPKGYKGDWWQLPEKSTHILLRQIAYDWLNEEDGRYAIERLDTAAIKPRLTAKEIEEKLKQVAVWVENWATVTNAIAQRYSADGLVNKVIVRDLSSSGGFLGKKQLYAEGQYDISADEALIVEIQIPKQCRYWEMQLTGMVAWGSLDYVNRQISLNGHSAVLDSDGKFRAVISTIDPGVPNWLDNAGHKKGTIFGRFMECNTSPISKVTKVKFADVRKHLPDETANVSAEQREATIRLRRKGAQLRRRW